MRKNDLVWGGLLILLGGLLLLENMGLLPRGVNVWGIFWPLALIGLGVSWVLGAVGQGAQTETLAIPLEGSASARVKLHHGAGELRIDDAADPDQLLDGVFGGGVISDVRRDNGQARVDLRVPDAAFAWPVGPGRVLDWRVGFDRQIPLELVIEGGASRMILDLRNLRVSDLRLATGASATELYFPTQAGETRARIESGAASVDMRVPDGVAARIRFKGALSNVDIDMTRFARVGEVYESPDYASAENRLDLEVESGVGSVSVR